MSRPFDVAQGRFRALVLEEAGGKPTAAMRELDETQLPEGDVTVAVSHSTLNYKDGLILAGIGGLVRTYPHVPGIDFAGTVTESRSPEFRPGDAVILTGWRVGETRWGGYAERARVRSEWLVKMPAGLDARRAMTLGTAGLTAMLAVMTLEEAGVTSDAGEVLVTGAAGGLGGVAIALLARLGYKVAAATGRAAAAERLRALGAGSIVDRQEISGPPARPLLSARWAGCIDAVGGAALPAILAAMRYGGAVAACGNAGGNEFATSVLPFILRGVRLLGVDSVMCPLPRRQAAWQRLARDMPRDALDRLTTLVALEDVPRLAARILKGETEGRIVIAMDSAARDG
jgi:acrylyl-CoA reductase (NADPH)